MTMTDVPLVVPQSKIALVTQAVREAGDLLRAGEHAADLQMVHTSAAERIHFALGHLLELGIYAWTPDPEPKVILGPIVPEGGETRASWLREQGIVRDPSPLARDDEIDGVSTSAVHAEFDRAVDAAAAEMFAPNLGPARDATKVLGFTTYGDTGLDPDELERVRRAVAAEPVAADEAVDEGAVEHLGLEVEIGEPEAAADEPAVDDVPFPCPFCDREDFGTWAKIVGHMRGKHQESLIRRDYEAWKLERSTPS
jgi:hypothetical protein